MQIKILSDKSEVIEQARVFLNKALHEHGDESVLFLVSGGSALELLQDLDLNSNMTIGVLDERYSEDPSINNFKQLQQTDVYKKAQGSGCKFIDTSADGLSQDELVQKFDQSLHDWKQNNPTGKVVITQGIGEDGHTSGIMPYPEDEEFFNKTFCAGDWVVGFKAGEKNQYPQRVTTTISFLKNFVDTSLVYAVGEGKLKTLQDAITQGSLAEVPARVIQEMRGVNIFTDQKINL